MTTTHHRHHWNIAMYQDAGRQGESVELEYHIKQRIDTLTAGRVRSLAVDVSKDRITIHGRALCYYHKQLALQAVLETISGAKPVRIDLNVEVDAKVSDSADSSGSQTGETASGNRQYESIRVGSTRPLSLGHQVSLSAVPSRQMVCTCHFSERLRTPLGMARYQQSPVGEHL